MTKVFCRSSRAVQVRSIFLTLAVAGLGASTASVIGISAAALIGSTAAVSCLSFTRLTFHIPRLLRNLAYAVIGCSLGSCLSPEIIDLAHALPASIAMLTLLMAAILFCSSRLLSFYFGQSRETALLASSPGALSYSLAIASEGVGDVRAIVVLQSVRLLFIITGLPLLLEFVSGGGAGGRGAIILQQGYGSFFLILTLTLIVARSLKKFAVPAIYLLAGLAVSGVSHFAGIVSGNPPQELLYAGFMVTGAVVGSRFSAISYRELCRLGGAALTIVVVSTSFSALFSYASSILLRVPFAQMWVAYAPGGVEAMAAMALALEVDSAFVVTHHLYRIFFLLLFLPPLLRLTAKSSDKDVSMESMGIQKSEIL